MLTPLQKEAVACFPGGAQLLRPIIVTLRRDEPMPPINRRDLLVVTAAAAALAVAPPLRAAIGFDVDRFLSLRRD